MSKNPSSREEWLFPTALGAAIAFHALLAVTWQSLPFAGAAENQAPYPIETEFNEISVQLVAPPPPPPAPVEQVAKPEPVEEPPPRPEPEPTPTPKPEPVIATPAMTAPTTTAPPEPPDEPPAKEVRPTPPRPTPPPPRAQPKPEPGPVSKPAPVPAERPEKIPSSALITGPPTPPSYRSNPKPAYPSDARRARAQGTTYLRVEIAPSGAVGRVTVIKSSGNASLDASALHTVSTQWRFHPAKRGGVAVSAVVTVPVRFQLK